MVAVASAPTDEAHPTLLRRLDGVQRRSAFLSFGVGVVKKYGEDSGAKQAALLTYYGFLSSIPLLLIVVWAASGILRDDPQLRDDFINSLVPEQLTDAVTSALAAMPTSPLPLIVGIAGLLYTGNGIVFTAYDVLNQLQAVPYRDRFTFVPKYLRAFAALLVILFGVVLLGLVIVGSSAVNGGIVGTGLMVMGAWVVLSVMLLVSVALLSVRRNTWRGAWPAAILGGAVLAVVILVGGVALSTFVARSGAVYGSFAVVVGIFSLLYLVSQALVFSGEVAVVRRRHLWPRALMAMNPTEADQRALALRVGIEQRSEADQVVVSVRNEPAPDKATDGR